MPHEALPAHLHPDRFCRAAKNLREVSLWLGSDIPVCKRRRFCGMLFGIVIAPTESPFPPCVGSTMVDVSVVIATYNRASMLREAIDSVLAQTEPVREVIVVDDGSTDNTRDVLSGYGSRIVALYQPQSGASAARNRAIRAATGEWIAFLDDDDIWLDSKIERQMVIAKGNRNLGLVYCSDYAVDEKLQILWERAAAAENRGNVFDRLFVRNFIFTSCVMDGSSER